MYKLSIDLEKINDGVWRFLEKNSLTIVLVPAVICAVYLFVTGMIPR